MTVLKDSKYQVKWYRNGWQRIPNNGWRGRKKIRQVTQVLKKKWRKSIAPSAPKRSDKIKMENLP